LGCSAALAVGVGVAALGTGGYTRGFDGTVF
jgi:hypothetical protein